MVADPQVRRRGTFGGSLVHADPAGDLPTTAVALDAEFVIAGPGDVTRASAFATAVDGRSTAGKGGRGFNAFISRRKPGRLANSAPEMPSST